MWKSVKGIMSYVAISRCKTLDGIHLENYTRSDYLRDDDIFE